jgi:addiction module HigA family antidote
MSKRSMRPVHPGEVLEAEYLAPLGLTVNALAKALHVPGTRLHDSRRRIEREVSPRAA